MWLPCLAVPKVHQESSEMGIKYLTYFWHCLNNELIWESLMQTLKKWNCIYWINITFFKVTTLGKWRLVCKMQHNLNVCDNIYFLLWICQQTSCFRSLVNVSCQAASTSITLFTVISRPQTSSVHICWGSLHVAWWSFGQRRTSPTRLPALRSQV